MDAAVSSFLAHKTGVMSTAVVDRGPITQKPPPPPAEDQRSPGPLQRLFALPFVVYLAHLWGRHRRNSPRLDGAIVRAESVLTRARLKAHQWSTLVKQLRAGQLPDSITSTVTTGKEYITKTFASTKKTMRRSKRTAVQYLEQKAGVVLRSLPGRVVVWSVDRVCGAAETALIFLRPELGFRPRKLELRNGHHHGNSEKDEHRKKEQSSLGIFIIITKPLELLVFVMKGFQGYIHRIIDKEDHSKKNGCLSPEKECEIQSRRKVSPRKKIKTGLVNQLQRTVNYFGLYSLIPGLRRKFHIDLSGQGQDSLVTSPNKAEEDDKKRKYEEILSESDDSEDELGTMDLEQYVSDEDPDFRPGQEDSTDSEEYREGDTESDIEFETTLGGTTQVKVRSKSVSKESPAAEQSKGKPDAAKIVNSTNTGEQSKPAPSKAAQPSVVSPSKSSIKSNSSSGGILKCSTPKPSSAPNKENAPPPDVKLLANTNKKTPESKHGGPENTDKKPDSKSLALANGDRKAENKAPQTNGSKKGSNGDKK